MADIRLPTDKQIYSCPACKLPISTHLTRQHCIEDLWEIGASYAKQLEATTQALQKINMALWVVIKKFHGESVDIPKEDVTCTFEDGVLVEPTPTGIKMSLIKRLKQPEKTA